MSVPQSSSIFSKLLIVTRSTFTSDMARKRKSSEMDQDDHDSATVFDASDETSSSDGPARPCRRPRCRPSRCIEIDQKGDLSLQATPEVAFFLSSKILSMASGYFEELLNRTEFPSMIELIVEQDDLEAISLLFHLLHYRLELYVAEYEDQDQDPWTPDIDSLLRFAKLSDKYRCSAAVRLQGIRWLRQLQDADGEFEDKELYDFCIKEAQVAHLLDDPEGLQRVYESLAWFCDTETVDHIAKQTSFPEKLKGTHFSYYLGRIIYLLFALFYFLRKKY
jgi:hypothetical protein